MKAVEVKQAKRRLAAYAKMGYEAPVLLTSAGRVARRPVSVRKPRRKAVASRSRG